MLEREVKGQDRGGGKEGGLVMGIVISLPLHLVSQIEKQGDIPLPLLPPDERTLKYFRLGGECAKPCGT